MSIKTVVLLLILLDPGEFISKNISNNIIVNSTTLQSSINLKQNAFTLSLNEIFQEYKNGSINDEVVNVTFIIADDEFMIRNSIKRVLLRQLKDIKKNIKCHIIEACDGLECIMALYIATTKQIKVDAIISDENMAYMNGSYSSKVLENLMKQGKFAKTPMFVSSALLNIELKEIFSSIVVKIYSKPLDNNSVIDLLRNCKLI